MKNMGKKKHTEKKDRQDNHMYASQLITIGPKRNVREREEKRPSTERNFHYIAQEHKCQEETKV